MSDWKARLWEGGGGGDNFLKGIRYEGRNRDYPRIKRMLHVETVACLLNTFKEIENAICPISLIREEARSLGMLGLAKNRATLTPV